MLKFFQKGNCVKTRRKKISIFEAAAILFFVLILVILFIPSKRRSLETSSTRVQMSSVESSRTLEEMQTFMNTHLQTLLMETFPKRQFRFPEIQQRYDTLVQMIQKRYGTGHVFQAVNQYAAASKLVKMGASIENGVPTVTISMPALIGCVRNPAKIRCEL